MNTKTTIILLILALLLGAYLYFFERHQLTTDELSKLQKKLIAVDPKDITRLEITKQGAKEAIIMGKETDDKWLMSQPVSARADHTVINDITKDLPELEKNQVITSTDYAKYGLDKPAIIATFATKDNKTYQFNVGKEAPLGQGIYIQLVTPAPAQKQSEVYVVAKSFYEKLNKSLFDFRYKKAFEADAYKINRIEFKYSDGGIVDITKAGEAWELTRPVSDRCDKTKVQDVINAINDMQITSFEADDVTDFARYGLVPPELMMTVYYPNTVRADLPPQTEVMLIGKKPATDATKYYGMKQGTPSVFTVETTLANRLMVNSTEMRNKKPFEVDKEKVSRVTLKYGDTELFDIAKDKEQWNFIAPANLEFNQDAINPFIEKLNDTVVESFTAETETNLAALGLAEPFSGLALTYKEKDAEAGFRFGFGADPKFVYLKRTDAPRIVALNKDIYDYLRKGSIHFRKKGLLSVGADRIKSLVIDEPAKAKTVYIQDKTQEWSVITSADAAAVRLEHPENINSLRNQLCYLTASEFVAEYPDSLSPYGLDAPSTVVTIDYDKGDGTTMQKILKIGKKAENNSYYGMIDGQPMIFYLDNAVIEALQKVSQMPQTPPPVPVPPAPPMPPEPPK